MKLKRNAFIGLLVATNVIGAGVLGGTAAAEEKKPNYVQAKFGVFQPTDGLDDAGFDTGVAGAISYGRYLTRHLILEGTVEGAATSTGDVDGVSSFAGYYSLKSDIWITAFLLSLKQEIPAGPVNFYVGGGIGAYVVTLYSEVDSSRFGDYDDDDTDTVFGVHLLAGANYNLNESWYVGVEGTYRWTGSAKLENDIIGVPAIYDDNLNGFSLSASVGFRF